MCRYHGTSLGYRTHFVCFPCRRSFKSGYYRETAPCPECGEESHNLGRDFKPPRRGSDNQWRKVELLVRRGIRFDSCGCEGPGYRPRTFSEAKRFS